MHTEEKKIHKRIYLTLKKKNPQGASVINGKHSFEILKAFEKGKKSNNCYESHDSLNHLLDRDNPT